MKKIISWAKRHYLSLILIVIIVFGVLKGTYTWGENTGINDFAKAQEITALKAFSANVSDDIVLNVATRTIKLAIYRKDAIGDDRLYIEISQYFRNLAESGKLRELTSGNNTD